MMRGRFVLGMVLVLLPSAAMAEYVGNLNPKGDNFLTLRQYASAKSKSLSRMGPDTIVEVLDRDGDWLYVETSDGRLGWAFSKYILPGMPAGPKAKTTPVPAPLAKESKLPAPNILDPYDWVEGHMMMFHNPLVYYP